jgi:protein SCO1
MMPLARACFGLLMVLALSGCNNAAEQFSGVDITGIQGYGADFRLTDHGGRQRTLADFRGKVVMLFFGYTQCPDVCPTTLSDLRQVMQKLGKNSERVQVLFVTVDPRRDTPELLAQYVPSFHPSFLGLSGDPDTIAKTARDFKIYYHEQPGKTPASYTIDHTAGTLVFDTHGRLRLFHSYGLSPDLIASDVQILLKQS